MKPVYAEILNTVSNYYETNVEDVLYKKTKTRHAYNVARVVATYFIRHYTGDAFCVIGRVWDERSGWPNHRYNRVVKKLQSDSPKLLNFKLQIEELDRRLSRKINLLVS